MAGVSEMKREATSSEGQKKHTSEEKKDDDKKGLIPESYPMSKQPLGRCIIIGKSLEANGEEVKVKGETLISFCKKLHYLVETFDNLEGLSAVASSDHSNFEAFLCFILNHEEKDPGKKGGYDEIIGMFSEAACPTLKGKPKMFFIDCNYIFVNDPMFSKAVLYCDLLIMPSLQDGMRSISDDFSSKYMKAVLTSFMELENVDDVCTRICDLMAEETYDIVNKKGKVYRFKPAGNGTHSVHFIRRLHPTHK